MKRFGRGIVFGLFLAGLLVSSSIIIESADARCCERVNGGCDSASEMGCASGDAQNIFFPNPCDCVSDECVDPTQGNAACGAPPNGECGDGEPDGGEECDDGAANGTFESCCNLDCTYKSNGSLCEDGIFCDGLGACDGAGTCVENGGGLPCPDPELCDEENRSCQTGAPAASAGVLIVLGSMLLAGGVLTARRLRRRHHI